MITASTLRTQRLAAVGLPPVSKCSGCGGDTRDRDGVCGPCRRTRARDLSRMPTEHVARLLAACKAELERRRAAIETALGGEP